jgi:hypothetical protein
MTSNNSYGLTILFIFATLVCLAFILNIISKKSHRITLDQAEKIFIFTLAIILVLIAIYTKFFGD